MNNNIYKVHQEFDKLNDELIDYKFVKEDIEEYILLKNKLNELENKIENKIKGTNFIFDKKNAILLDKTKQKIFVNITFNFFDKQNNKEEHFFVSNVISETIFNKINKFLKDDKEIACQFLNSQEISQITELKDINYHIKKMFCGICSTNNILRIITNKNNTDNNILYLVEITQIENHQQNFYGEISFVLK